VTINSPAHESRFFCQRTPHLLLPIDSFPTPANVVNKFKQMVPQVPRSNYRPVPIILALSPNTVSQDTASKSLLEFLRLADETKRKTPFLWIGPSAAVHIEIKNRKGNQEIWEYDKNMAKLASENDIEVLKMWNMRKGHEL